VRELAETIEEIARETRFSGVVEVRRGAAVEVAGAWGAADRAFGVPITLDTRFAIASGTKGLTALAVLSLVETGELSLDTTARSLLRDDLPLVDDAVTVEHLLCHRSGIGDYIDEEDEDLDLDAYLLAVPVHTLRSARDYLTVLDGIPSKASPGERFAYNNSGYVVLALLAERASGTPYHDLVATRVCGPAGMHTAAFLRSDELPGDAARGYLDVDGLRTNVLHLPVRGVGDGGVFTTAAEVHALWSALFGGRVLPAPWVTEVVRRRDGGAPDREGYGLGFWLPPRDGAVALEGADAGVSFRSLHVPSEGLTATVIANTTEGAWPLVRAIEAALLR
jgi:CubicO group peptidase (beta-lactamase class C family)